MTDTPYIAEVASLIGDPARANMLSALKDEGVLSATDLAHVAGIAPNTASGHLAKLAAARMVTVERRGRHRYYGLAYHEVAETLEVLEALAVRTAPRFRPKSRQDDANRYARSCYDHLAGRLGVRLSEALVQLDYIERKTDGFSLSGSGEKAFAAFSIDIGALKAKRRRMLRACPNWSEDTVHLGGALAASLFQRFCELGWLRKKRGNRIVLLTPKGRTALRQHFTAGMLRLEDRGQISRRHCALRVPAPSWR